MIKPQHDSAITFKNGVEQPAKADGVKDSAATKLIRIAESYELFHDATQEGYATVPLNGHRETIRVGSRIFRRFISHDFFKAEGKAPTAQALASALPTVEALAIHEGNQQDVHIRVAEADGTLCLDLCNDRWEAVRVTKTNWKVIQNPPVKFVRPGGMLPLPHPAKAGSLRDIERLTTIRGDELTLLKGFLLGCLRERGPFPILALIGEQGAGKTTLSRLVKRTIDPSKAAARCLPKDERDLMISADSQHILALDNLSHIDEQMSDALCRLATGDGLSTRSLYTDKDQTIFESERPIILNAITDVLTRSDLIDRAIIVAVPPLEESNRKAECDFWADFEKAHPLILGALCDAASLALCEQKVFPVPPVRMVDFALFVSRGETKLGLKRGAFVSAYEQNRREANECAIDFSAVAQALKQFMVDKSDWSGTAGELLQEFVSSVTEDVRHSREWPKTPRGLSGAIRRVIPNLRPLGLRIKMNAREAGTGRRLIEIKRVAEESSQSSHRHSAVSTVTA